MSARDGPFHPLRIEAIPCDIARAREHLDSFVRAFIRSNGRSRAEHILFRLAPHPDRLGALCKLLDDRYTSPPQDLSVLFRRVDCPSPKKFQNYGCDCNRG